MSTVTASMVKELRERTNLGMMDCKKALVESDGDMDLAIESLRKSSGLKAAKKAGRVASDGLVKIAISDDGLLGVLVEVNCETDFAARDESFLEFVDLVAQKVFEAKSGDIQAILDAGLEGQRETLVQTIGENISVRRAEVISLSEGRVYGYTHTDGKKAALVAISGGDDSLGKDIAMHIVASSPVVVRSEDAPAELLAKEKEIYAAQAAESGKPADIVEKMVQGRIRKFLAEISLMEQQFVKDADISIAELMKNQQATVHQFARFEVGEGIEVEDQDFGEEVRKQLG